jgi:hypothetical protein
MILHIQDISETKEKVVFCLEIFIFTIFASSFSHWPHLLILFVGFDLAENKFDTTDGRVTGARR